MTIDEQISIVKDNLDEYGICNITRAEYDAIYNMALKDFVELYKRKTSMENKLIDDIANILKR